MLSNEILFGLFMFGGLSIALGTGYLGRTYMTAMIIAIALYMNITEARVIEVFGYPTTLGTALYAVTFFLTDMMTERYGKAAGFKAIRLSIFSGLVFQMFLQLSLFSTAVPDMKFVADAMDVVYSVSFRIFAASMVVYAISQSFDIWFYHKIHDWTGGKHLWLRNNGSTFVSQAIDTYLFTFLAFYGVLDDWLTMATVMYGFKLVVALCDTPFMYLSKTFTPRDLRN